MWFAELLSLEKTGGTGTERKNWDHPDYCIKIGLNTQKSPGDLWRLAVTDNSNQLGALPSNSV